MLSKELRGVPLFYYLLSFTTLTQTSDRSPTCVLRGSAGYGSDEPRRGTAGYGGVSLFSGRRHLDADLGRC